MQPNDKQQILQDLFGTSGAKTTDNSSKRKIEVLNEIFGTNRPASNVETQAADMALPATESAIPLRTDAVSPAELHFVGKTNRIYRDMPFIPDQDREDLMQEWKMGRYPTTWLRRRPEYRDLIEAGYPEQEAMRVMTQQLMNPDKQIVGNMPDRRSTAAAADPAAVVLPSGTVLRRDVHSEDVNHDPGTFYEAVVAPTIEGYRTEAEARWSKKTGSEGKRSFKDEALGALGRTIFGTNKNYASNLARQLGEARAEKGPERIIRDVMAHIDPDAVQEYVAAHLPQDEAFAAAMEELRQAAGGPETGAPTDAEVQNLIEQMSADERKEYDKRVEEARQRLAAAQRKLEKAAEPAGRRIAEELFEGISERLIDKFAAENMPKNTFAALLRTAYESSLPGMIFEAGVEKAAGGEGLHRQIMARAMEKYDPSLLTTAAGEALGLLAGTPVFGAGGTIGRAGATGLRKVAEKIVARQLIGRGLAKEAAGKVAGRLAATNLGMRAGEAAIASGSALGTYDAAAAPFVPKADGKAPELSDVLASAGKGFATGAVIGPLGVGTGFLSQKAASKLGRYAAQAGGFAAENAAFVGMGTLYRGLETGEWGTAEELAEDFGKSVGVLSIMKSMGRLREARERKPDFYNEVLRETEFTPEEQDALSQVGVDGRTYKRAIFDLLNVRETSREAAEEIRTHYDEIMRSREVPMSAKAKLLYLVEGRMPDRLPLVTEAVRHTDETGRTTVDLLDPAGNLVQRRLFGSDEAAEAFERRSDAVRKANRIHYYENAVEEMQARRAVEEGARIVAEERGLSAEGLVDEVLRSQRGEPHDKDLVKAVVDRARAIRSEEGDIAQMLETGIEIKYGLNEGELFEALRLREADRTPEQQEAVGEYASRLQEFARGQNEPAESNAAEAAAGALPSIPTPEQARMEQIVGEAEQRIEASKNIADGILYEATTKSNEVVQIINGHVVFDSETGEVDYTASDATVIAGYPDGSRRQISIRDLDSIDEAIPAQDAVEQVKDALTAVADTVERPDIPEYSTVRLSDGTEGVVEGRNEDGSYRFVTMDEDGRWVQREVDASEVAGIGDSPAAAETEPGAGDDRTGSPSTDGEPRQAAEQTESEAAPEIPRLKNGAPDYNAMPADMLAVELSGAIGHERAVERLVVSRNVKTKEIDKLRHSLENTGDLNKAMAFEAKLAAAEGEIVRLQEALSQLGYEESAALQQRNAPPARNFTEEIGRLFPEGLPNVRARVLADIAGGQRFVWSDSPDGSKRGMATELGFAGNESERRARFGILGSEKGGAKHVSRYVHDLWEDSSGYGLDMDDAALRDEVIDVLLSTPSRSSAMDQLRQIASRAAEDPNAPRDAEDAEALRAYEEERKALREAENRATFVSDDNNAINGRAEESRRNHDEPTFAPGNDGGRLAGDATGGMARVGDRSDIRVLEEGLAASYREHSDGSERDRRAAESERLVNAARKNGLYIDANRLSELGDKQPGKTGESVVYVDRPNDRVYKSKNPYAKAALKGNAPEDAIFEHVVHNRLFPEAPYRFEGISDYMGDVRIVLSQDYIESTGRPTQQQIEAALAARGLYPDGRYSYGNDLVSVTDLDGDNVLLGPDENIYFIDPIIKLKRPASEVLDEMDARTDDDVPFSIVQHRSAAPEGIDAERWNAIVDQLRRVVGDENVVTNLAEVRAKYTEITARDEKQRKKEVAAYFRTPKGEVYGFTVDGKIYLDAGRMNAEAPMHEYTELWSQIVARENPRWWARAKEIMQNDFGRLGEIWKEVNVDPNYRDLPEDLRASETVARASAEWFARQQAGIKENEGLFDALRRIVREFWRKLKSALSEYWSDDTLRRMRADDVMGAPVKDFTDGIDLQRYRKERADAHKWEQMEIINRHNPMTDDVHAGIRTVDDIKSFEEIVEEARTEGADIYPDMNMNLFEEAAETGRITVYSSYPIRQGVFVTPSRISAEEYAGGEKVYSKTIPVNDVAWIAPDQGQYAKVRDKQSSQDDARFNLIGEKGALSMDRVQDANIRLNNLEIARAMEADGANDKKIKLATGWERGVDNKWRYEIGDAKIADMIQIEGRNFQRNKEDMLWNDGPLEKVVVADELFSAYPELRSYRIDTDAIVPLNSNGAFNSKTKTITIHASSVSYMNSILNHELQHAIQDIEGFYNGGNETISRAIGQEIFYELNREAKEVVNLYNMADRTDAAKRAQSVPENDAEFDTLLDAYLNTPEMVAADRAKAAFENKTKRFLPNNVGYYADFGNKHDFANSNAHIIYHNLAGEVEARNIQSRLKIPKSDRMTLLAKETEDVNREDQLNLTNILSEETAYVPEFTARHSGSKQSKREQLIAQLRQAIRDERRDVRAAVKLVGRRVREQLGSELIDVMGKRDFDDIVRRIEEATVRRDAEGPLRKIAETVLDLEIKRKRDAVEKLLDLRVQGETPRGVSIAANVDDQTREFFEIIRDNRTRPAQEVASLLEEKGASLDAKMGAALLENYQAAQQYEAEIKEIGKEIEALRKASTQLRRERIAANKEGRKDTADALQAEINRNSGEIEALEGERVRTKEMQSMQLSIVEGDLRDAAGRGRDIHREWLKAREEHKIRIAKWAFRDIGTGKQIPILDRQPGVWEKGRNRIKDFFLEPAYSLNYLLKMVSVNAPKGEGALYDHFMRGEYGYVEARGRYYTGYESFKAQLDAKAREIFGKGYKEVLSDSNRPTEATITIVGRGYRSGLKVSKTGEMREEARENHIVKEEYAPTIGEAMYIYMVDKMEDGRVKLRKMGIEESEVAMLADILPVQYVRFADWLQNEFLPERRKTYNETHLEVFGTQMAEIENYVPLRIQKSNVYEEVDGTKTDVADLPSAITGSIIRRKRNTLTLDLHTNVLDLMLDHGQQMEHWNAFTRVVQDMNALLSNTTLRRMLNDRNPGLHKKLNVAAQIAADSYRPETNATNRTWIALGKLAASSKIAFRINTAIKQVLSYPAFYAYSADPKFWASVTKNLSPTTWGKNFRWCLDNVPSFRERWLGRLAGNEKLAQLSAPQIDRWIAKMGQWGMFPNALVDAVTCANGAKAVYDYKRPDYRKKGYEDAEAERRARIDAALAINETQQSGEGMFLSRVQVERDFWSVSISTFQNSNFAYLRKQLEGIDELCRDAARERRNRAAFYKEQGMSDTQADEAALRDVVMAKREAVGNILTFMFVMNVLWGIGNNVWKYIFAEDGVSEAGKEMLQSAGVSTIRNTSVGSIVESVAAGHDMNPSVLLSDLSGFIGKVQRIAEQDDPKSWDQTAAYIALQILSVNGIGIDMNTFVTMYEGVAGMIRDGADAEDVMLLLNAPRSQAKLIASEPKAGESMEDYQRRVGYIERRIWAHADKKQLGKWARNYKAYRWAELLGLETARDVQGRVTIPELEALNAEYDAVLKEAGLSRSGNVRADMPLLTEAQQEKFQNGFIKRIFDIGALQKALDADVVFNETYTERLRRLLEMKRDAIEEWRK